MKAGTSMGIVGAAAASSAAVTGSFIVAPGAVLAAALAGLVAGRPIGLGAEGAAFAAAAGLAAVAFVALRLPRSLR